MLKKFSGIFLSIFLINSLVWAQQIRMGPPIVELLTTPASTQTFYLSIVNQTENEVSCIMMIRSMDITKDGMPFPVDSSARSAAPWLKIHEEANFLLKGNETKKIRCSFRPALKAEPGGYYGMILCRTSEPKEIGEGKKSKLQTRIKLRFQFACVIMAVVKGANVQAKVEPEGPKIFAGNRAGKDDRNWYAEMPVRNDGNIHVVLDGDVQLLSETGQLISKIGLIAGKGYLLPGQRRVFKSEGKGPLPDGVYVADIRLGQSEINQFATEKVPFYIVNGSVKPGFPDKKVTASLEETSQGFILDKTNLNIETAPGGKQYQVVQLINITNRPIEITSTIFPWDQNKEGDVVFPEKSKHGKELAHNITIDPIQFKLEPKQRKNIKFVFQLPKEASGEYFDAVVFNRIGTTPTNNAALRLTQSVLTAIKIRKTEQLKHEVIGFTAEEIKNKGFLFIVTAKNLGNMASFPEGRINIFNKENVKIDETIVFGKDTFILPNNERDYNIELGRILSPGNYRAELTYTYSPDAKAIQKLLNFTAK